MFCGKFWQVLKSGIAKEVKGISMKDCVFCNPDLEVKAGEVMRRSVGE